ncbi:MAG: hypothetical protein Q7T87_12055 [Polaromonas sp.]|nr:hypothetical protein [Polaromonas sp.]
MLSLTLGCCAAAAMAAGDVLPAATHPVVGTWSWTLFDGKCTETRQYRANGTLLSTSGESVVEWTYAATPNAGEAGFYTLTERPVRENGKKDCYGDEVDETGDAQTRYVQFSPALDRLIVCKTESLQACYGPLVRVP